MKLRPCLVQERNSPISNILFDRLSWREEAELDWWPSFHDVRRRPPDAESRSSALIMLTIVNCKLLHLRQNYITRNNIRKQSGITDAVSVSIFQALLLLEIFVYYYLEKSNTLRRAQQDGNHYIGYQWTNEDCLRVFPTHCALVRHKTHNSQKRTLCTVKMYSEAMFEVNENRPSSLQSLRIIIILIADNLNYA